MEIAERTSVRIYVTFAFRTNLNKWGGNVGNPGAYTFILPLSLFSKYLSTFLDVLSMERILKQNKNTSEYPRTNSGRF